MKALARERLAPATEKKRLFFVERLEVIKMPPSLPPSRDHKLTGQSKEYSIFCHAIKQISSLSLESLGFLQNEATQPTVINFLQFHCF